MSFPGGYVDGWGGLQPWQDPECNCIEPTLYGGVMAASHLDRAPVVEVLR